jgi:uncharacterized protein
MATNYVYSDFEMDLTKASDGDITRDLDVEAIQNSIKNIMETRKGSRRMLPEFGVNIYELLFEPMDDITARAIGESMLYSIEMWEPRISITNLNVFPDEDNNLYDITVSFTINDMLSQTEYSVRTILKRE